MMRKILSAVLVFGLVFTMMAGLVNPQINGLGDRYRIGGYVYNSADGVAKIYEDSTWVCTNITIYNVSEYEIGIMDLAIDNNETDNGEDFLEKDKFYFDAGEQWANWSWGDTLVSVGETNNSGVNYVFFTSAVLADIPVPDNFFEETEWEPIPTPIVYAKGDGWINISIPKFTNPVLASYGISGTPNANNTIGFAVYRNGTEHIGNATYSNATHYFYNDTISSDIIYHYSVAPIARGNYTTYGKSLLASSEELSVTLNSPAGGECWTGGDNHNIEYTITGGSPPYNVVLSYSTNGGATYPNTINKTIRHNEEGTYTYDWSVPGIDSTKMVAVRINVTDCALSIDSKTSSAFTIDSTAPTVKSTIPPGGGSVSITKSVTIVFNETMNKTAAQAAFSISPNPGGWAWTWNDAGDTMTGTHNDFVFGTTYTATITTAAKDLAGNYLGNAYPWNFTASMGVCLNSPALGDVWTGGSTHDIEYEIYEIIGCVPPYTVTINYTTDGENYNLINTTTKNAEGVYSYSWVLPETDSKTVDVKIVVVDANGTESMDTSGNFEIDSTAPTITDYSGNDTIVPLTASITVWFSEEMNTASVGIGAVQAGDAFGLFKEGNSTKIAGTITWNEDKDTMIFKPDENLTQNTKYTAVINTNAKDKSNPGNSLTSSVSWNFTAVKGRGDFIVDFDYPLSPEKGKTYSLTVTLYNTGEKSENVSGALTVKFYASKDAVFSESDLIYTGHISNIEENESDSASAPFTFDDYGTYYFLIEINSDNPTDLFPNGKNTYTTSASVNIQEPTEEIGAGPYTLIALMVVIVIIIAALILLSLKKKGELTLKEKKEEEKEEWKKEGEEEKKKEEGKEDKGEK